ncbi:MAG TPA: ABC transporter permease [Dissulfurispiraceae bacterium]|nr:ABC transporter permease [Dissulfurispiraceae bacterium]
MFILKLIFKNAFRHKLRTWLTIVGITIAILAYGLLRTVISTWYAGVESSSATRLVTRNAISLVFSLPLSYEESIRHVPGVKFVTRDNWFGGIYIDEKHFFPSFAIDPKNYLPLVPEFVIPGDQQAAFIRDRNAALAGRKIAEKYHWKIGDTITLKGTIFPGNWEFVLRAIYHGRDKSTDETFFLFHWDYLNEALKKTASRRADQVGFYFIGVTSPNLAAEVSQAIDKMFKNSLSETLTETEKAFQLGFISMSEAIIVAIRMVSFVVIIIIMAVMANTMAMTARERFGEYAVFKALGFGGVHLAGLIFGESLVIAILGGAAGIALTFPVARAFGRAMDNYFPVFNVAKTTIYMDMAAALLIGLVAGIVPAWRAVHIRVADGLRRIG